MYQQIYGAGEDYEFEKWRIFVNLGLQLLRQKTIQSQTSFFVGISENTLMYLRLFEYFGRDVDCCILALSIWCVGTLGCG